MVVESIQLEQPKTKQAAAVMRALGLEGVKTLMLVDRFDENVLRATRNLPYLDIMLAENVAAYHVLSHRKLLLVPGAIEVLARILTPKSHEPEEVAA